eukprot:gene8807-8986_t
MDLIHKLKAKGDKLKAAFKDVADHHQQQDAPPYLPPPVYNAVKALAPMGSPGGGHFTHPGTLMGPGELNLLRQRAARAVEVDQVWLAALQSLLADTPVSYTPHALTDVLVEWDNGPKRGHDELVEKDGKMVYMQTCAWLVTNDDRYARNAAGIINSWARQNRSFAGKNAPLEAGWGVDSMARSVELLKCTWPGWNAELEGRFLSWVNRLIMPQLNNEMLERLPLANWQTTVAECKAQLAILTGNKALWEDALRWWHRVFDAYVKPCGECGETSRDLYHSQFGMGGLIQLAEIAWHQGVNLYSSHNSRLVNMMEFHAYITNGGKPKECCYPLKGIGFLPCGWEVGYNHYVNRMGLQLPETAKLLAAHRPEKYVFHWGLGTLTHYKSGELLRRPLPS